MKAGEEFAGRVAELERLLAAATQGPWEWKSYGELAGPTGETVLYGDSCALDGYRVECESDADATLIASAPTAIADLLAALRAHRSALQKVRAMVDDQLIGNALIDFPNMDETLKTYLDTTLDTYPLP